MPDWVLAPAVWRGGGAWLAAGGGARRICPDMRQPEVIQLGQVHWILGACGALDYIDSPPARQAPFYPGQGAAVSQGAPRKKK
jgi:hypothetical protein